MKAILPIAITGIAAVSIYLAFPGKSVANPYNFKSNPTPGAPEPGTDSYTSMSTLINNQVNNLPVNPYRTIPKRQLDAVTMIVVHHDAGEGDSIEAIAAYHTSPGSHICPELGCPTVAYHFYIRKSGEIIQALELDTIGYHAKGSNEISIGICLAGNLNNHPPTPAQLNSLELLIGYLQTQLPGITQLNGHRDIRDTECPGFYLDIHALRLRTSIS